MQCGEHSVLFLPPGLMHTKHAMLEGDMLMRVSTNTVVQIPALISPVSSFVRLIFDADVDDLTTEELRYHKLLSAL